MGSSKCDTKAFFQPAFLICAVVLGVTGGTKGLWGPIAKKEPLPLKKSLDQLENVSFAPYQVVSKSEIVNDEILKELGTQDYLQWVFEDTDTPLNSPVHRILLFITYYELPDRVPHVPEECYTGGGFQRMTTDTVAFSVDAPGFVKTVPGRFLLFGSANANLWGSRGTFPVLYFFKVNGEYANSRDDARITLNRNLFGKASYFSKVEMVFNRTSTPPTKSEAVVAAGKLLSKVLPVLEREYWPDWPPREDVEELTPALDVDY